MNEVKVRLDRVIEYLDRQQWHWYYCADCGVWWAARKSSTTQTICPDCVQLRKGKLT
jgi:hypothetical protein